MTERWKQRQAARAAAALIVAELLENDAVLSGAAEDIESVLTVRRMAWDAHASALLRVRGGSDALTVLVTAYNATDLTRRAAERLVAEQARYLVSGREALREGDAERGMLYANAIEEADETKKKLVRKIGDRDRVYIQEAVQVLKRLSGLDRAAKR